MTGSLRVPSPRVLYAASLPGRRNDRLSDHPHLRGESVPPVQPTQDVVMRPSAWRKLIASAEREFYERVLELAGVSRE